MKVIKRKKEKGIMKKTINIKANIEKEKKVRVEAEVEVKVIKETEKI